MKINLTHCPVCDKEFSTASLRFHVMQKAKSEFYKYYNTKKKMPHHEYFAQHTKKVTKTMIVWKD